MDITIFGKEQVIDGFTVKENFIGLSEDGKFIAFMDSSDYEHPTNPYIVKIYKKENDNWTSEWIKYGQFPEIPRALQWFDGDRLKKERREAFEKAANIPYNQRCKKESFTTFRLDEKTTYECISPGIYKKTTRDIFTNISECSYEMITNDRYKELIEKSL